jgi:hypothetical protein
MEPRNGFRKASRARHAKAAEEDRGSENEKEGVVRVQEEIIPEIGSKVGSNAKQVKNSSLAALCLVAHGACAQASSTPPAPNPVGVWRGTSLCTVRPSPCNDEIAVYRITRVNVSDSVSLDARKVVNGQEEEMGGPIGCHLSAKGAQLTCTMSYGVWSFTIRGDSLVGSLTRPDGTKYRDIKTSRSR